MIQGVPAQLFKRARISFGFQLLTIALLATAFWSLTLPSAFWSLTLAFCLLPSGS